MLVCNLAVLSIRGLTGSLMGGSTWLIDLFTLQSSKRSLPKIDREKEEEVRKLLDNQRR